MDFKLAKKTRRSATSSVAGWKQNLPRDWRDDGELADPDTKTEFERRRSWHRKLYDGGWMCIHWPKEYGGRGATLASATGLPAGTRSREGAAGRQFPGYRARRPDPDAMGYAGDRKSATSRGFRPPRKSGARDCRSRITAPTSPRSRPARSMRATTSSSTAPRSGPRTRITPTSSTLLCRTDPDAAQA